MKIIISPAKLLDYSKNITTPLVSTCHFLEDADFLAKKLQKMTSQELKDLMKISNDLSEVNFLRYQNWEKPIQKGENSKPAITVFNGEVYKGFDAESLTANELKNAQEKVRILSGLYGLLKPLDLMYPYRLEMGTKWQISSEIKNLYQFWKDKITDLLLDEMSENKILINLASNEYMKVIDFKRFNRRIITPVFKEYRGGQYKTIMMYAKNARGLMARDIVKSNYKNVEDLKGFYLDNYSFNEQLSTESEWVFVR